MLVALFDSVPSVEKLGALLFAECTNHGFQFLFVETLTAIRMSWDVWVDYRPERHRLLSTDDALAIGCLSHRLLLYVSLHHKHQPAAPPSRKRSPLGRPVHAPPNYTSTAFTT